MKPRALRWLFAGVMLLPAGCDRGEREVPLAHVDGAGISPLEGAIELRAMLWRRGETWTALDEVKRKERRQEAVDRCIEERLLMNFAKQPTNLPAVQAKAAEDEFQQFLKQFEGTDEWKTRLDLQQVGEVQMRSRIEAEVVQDAAVERWLSEQRPQDADESERAARAWFEAHRQEMRIPERANVSHCFLTGHNKEKPDRTAEIAELHRRLTEGETTFESMTTKFSEDPRSNKAGGKLGWISRDRIPGDLSEQVFSVPLKKPSAPFRTRLGWHIIVVHERRAARVPEFTEVKAEIRARLDAAWREAAVKRLMDELRTKAKIVVHESEVQMLEPAAP
jgi:parvulin-like peptidyl-prolyl isomerase